MQVADFLMVFHEIREVQYCAVRAALAMLVGLLSSSRAPASGAA